MLQIWNESSSVHCILVYSIAGRKTATLWIFLTIWFYVICGGDNVPCSMFERWMCVLCIVHILHFADCDKHLRCPLFSFVRIEYIVMSHHISISPFGYHKCFRYHLNIPIFYRCRAFWPLALLKCHKSTLIIAH